MKKILIKSAKIIDEASSFHGKVVNIALDKGKIAYVGKDVPKADKVIEAKGMFITIGWFDMRAAFGDPGFEHKEDMYSGARAAAAGGFTGVAVLPNNKPVTQTKNDIKYIKSANKDILPELFPISAVTIDTNGEELTEMIDLHQAGAVAFSDGIQPIWQTDILLKSLQYLQKFDGLLINKPEDVRLNLFGVINEGTNSTRLGMKGMPHLAEELIIQRDLELLNYTGGRLHFSNISSGKSVAMIKAAKKQGLKVTCDIAAYQSEFDDSALTEFDTNFKVNPPFRSKKDSKALKKGLKEDIIDVIVSSHIPQNEESKKLEFDLADFGVISLQTVAHNIALLAEEIPLENLIKKITSVPRQLLGLDCPVIEQNKPANLTLFNPNCQWTLDKKSNFSKSQNSPYWDKPIKGKVIATFNQGKHFFDVSVI